MKKYKQSEVGIIIFLSLVAEIILLLLSNWLLKELMLNEYSPDYFVCVKLPFSVFYIFYPIFFLFVFLVAIYFYPGKKLTNKKYICFCSAVLCIALAITIALCGNVWSFNKDKIEQGTVPCSNFCNRILLYKVSLFAFLLQNRISRPVLTTMFYMRFQNFNQNER